MNLQYCHRELEIQALKTRQLIYMNVKCHVWSRAAQCKANYSSHITAACSVKSQTTAINVRQLFKYNEFKVSTSDTQSDKRKPSGFMNQYQTPIDPVLQGDHLSEYNPR